MVVKPEEIKVEQNENDKDFIINQVSEVVTNMEKRNNKKFEHLRDLLEKQVALTKDIQTQEQTQKQEQQDKLAAEAKLKAKNENKEKSKFTIKSLI